MKILNIGWCVIIEIIKIKKYIFKDKINSGLNKEFTDKKNCNKLIN